MIADMQIDPTTVSVRQAPEVGAAAPAAGSFPSLLHQSMRASSFRVTTFGEMVAAQTGHASRSDGAAGPNHGDGVASLGPAAPSPSPAGRPAALAWVTPVTPARVSSSFGMRRHPVTGVERMHDGMDLAAPTGTSVRAAAPGTVTFAGRRGGYGLLVIVDHGDGMETRYAHQSRLDVQPGDTVGAGDQLGAVGATGLATGPHLHFELRRNGTPVDPAPLLEVGA